MKNRQNLGWSLYQIDPRRQKEDTGGKINKIDITPTPYFCWIRARPDAQIRQRSKIRCPVVWGLEALRGRRMRDSGSGGEGFAPHHYNTRCNKSVRSQRKQQHNNQRQSHTLSTPAGAGDGGRSPPQLGFRI